jgi:hypothetical protein
MSENSSSAVNGIGVMASGASSRKEQKDKGSRISQNYLKSYPYLFVRENDQTDYFCTLCDTFLKEEELQSHLFEGHQAEGISNFFVRVCTSTAADKGILFKQLQSKNTYICVVCWAKIADANDTAAHRLGCKADPADGDLDNGAVPLKKSASPPQNVISTPDIANLINNNSSSNCSDDMNGSNGSDGSRPHSPPSDVIIDLAAAAASSSFSDQHSIAAATAAAAFRMDLNKRPASSRRGSKASPVARNGCGGGGSGGGGGVVNNQCVQCSLCSMVVPYHGQTVHLRDFHRITCAIEDASCPLCMAPVAVTDLSSHLVSGHGILTQAAAGSVLFWVLCNLNSNTACKPPHPFQSSSSSTSLTANGGDVFTSARSKLSFPTQPLFEMTKTSASHLMPPLSSLVHAPHQQQTHTAQVQAAAQGGIINVKPSSSLLDNHMAAAAAAVAAAANLVPNGLGAAAAAQIPTVLQSLLSSSGGGVLPAADSANQPTKLAAVENIVSKFTRCHVGPNGKESIQCLVCSKWFAVPPVKHLRGHMITFKDEKRRLVSLISGAGHVCIICYDVFDDLDVANRHFALKHEFNVANLFPNGLPNAFNSNNNIDNGGIEEMHPFSVPHHHHNQHQHQHPVDDLPTVIEPAAPPPPSMMSQSTLSPSKKKSHQLQQQLMRAAVAGTPKPGVELDNAGRVKSGKVR